MLKNAKKWFDKREGAKKLDLKRSAEEYEVDFEVYYPNPNVPIETYKDEDGNINLEAVPNEDLLVVECRYLSPGEFRDYSKPDVSKMITQKDIDALKDFSGDQFNKKVEDLLVRQVHAIKSLDDTMVTCVYHAVLDPQFESEAQVRQVLPTDFLITIYNEITLFVGGENLKALEDEEEVN